MSDLKAYAVLEDSENTGGIVFAKRAIVARREGSSQFGSGEFEGWSCRRASWADAWADKDEDVPARLMIEHGWHFECCGCGHKIDEDWLNDEELPLDGVSGTQHSRVYCSEVCECRDNLHRAIKRDCERRAILALQEFVLKRFPGIAFEQKDNWKPHAYAVESDGVWQAQESVVSFAFPGMKIGAATCRLQRSYPKEKFIGPIWPEYSCCAGDRESFEAWAASPESRVKISEAA